MTSPSHPARLLQHVRVKAPVERVYKALTQADELLKWLPDRAQVDARPGGDWAFEFDAAEGVVHKACGKFLELIPNQLVRYSWTDPMDDEDRVYCNLTVGFRLLADGDETDLYLEETGYGEGALDAELFAGRTRGWGRFLPALAELLAA